MNTRNAWGFLSFGLLLGLLPLLAPTWFPPTGIDGTSARALWLELMGIVQTAIGGVRVLWQSAVPAIIRWLASVPSQPAVVLSFEQELANLPAEPEFDATGAAEAA